MTEMIPEPGFDLIEKIKHIFGCIIRFFITIDPGPFAPAKYTLMAEYSREKSYLYVYYGIKFIKLMVQLIYML